MAKWETHKNKLYYPLLTNKYFSEPFHTGMSPAKHSTGVQCVHSSHRGIGFAVAELNSEHMHIIHTYIIDHYCMLSYVIICYLPPLI